MGSNFTPEESQFMYTTGTDVAEPLEVAENEGDVTSRQSYIGSANFFELFGCLLLLSVGLVLELGPIPVWERTIPIQIISDDNGQNQYIRDLTYNESDEGATVGTALLMVIVVLALVTQLSVAYFYSGNKQLHATFCCHLASFSLTLLAVDFCKLYCGFLRPIFYDMCDPTQDFEVCTGSSEKEARLSFPSGHAALSFESLGLLFLYLHNAFGAPSGPCHATRWISIASTIPLYLALFVAASRVHDNFHHPADVVGGSTLGLAVAYFCHYLWFDNIYK